jgi:hypothetical protein
MYNGQELIDGGFGLHFCVSWPGQRQLYDSFKSGEFTLAWYMGNHGTEEVKLAKMEISANAILVVGVYWKMPAAPNPTGQ